MTKARMTRAFAVSALLVALAVFGGVGRIAAQQSTETTKAATQDSPKLVEAYRLDFSINELEDGKKINTRQYSMNLNGNDSNDLKIGTRVPLEGKEGQFEYIDVGTNISARMQSRNGQVEVFVHTDMSNFAVPEQAQVHDPHPVIRQLKISGSTLAVLGKPMIIGSVDDPNSKRQFQVEVTVNKLR
jgi:hypothetical protein